MRFDSTVLVVPDGTVHQFFSARILFRNDPGGELFKTELGVVPSIEKMRAVKLGVGKPNVDTAQGGAIGLPIQRVYLQRLGLIKQTSTQQ